MKSLALIELEHHNEVLRAYLITFLQTEYHIVCFTNQFNRDQLYDLKDERITYLIKEKGQETASYFTKYKNELESCEVAIVSTIPLRDPFYQTMGWPRKRIFVVHKYHSYFEPYNHISLRFSREGFIDLAKLVRGWIKNYSQGYSKAIERFDAIVMPTDISAEYAKEKKKHGPQLLGSMDFAINESHSEVYQREVIQISVPGTINGKSRDYKLLVNALNRLSKQLKQKIEVHFLGKPKGSYGNGIIKQLREIENEKMSFVFYTSFIYQEVFDKIMLTSDFLILPIIEFMKFDVFLEKNGYSCVSGNLNDMIKYGLPSIMPKYYPVDSKLENMIGRYTNEEELSDVLLEWVESKKFNDIKNRTGELLIDYSTDKMSQKFTDIINKVI